MTQQEFTRIIETGQNVSMTPELMAAARESACRERSHAIHAAVRWMFLRTRPVLKGLTPTSESDPVVNTFNTRNRAHC